MITVFADAGYWIAMYAHQDELHQIARRVTRDLGQIHIITSEMVLVEFLNYASKGGQAARARAVDAERRLRDSANVEIVPQTGRQFRAAVDRYAKCLDQRWSITDCASFIIMEQRSLTDALAYDRDFVQAGFRALLREA